MTQSLAHPAAPVDLGRRQACSRSASRSPAPLRLLLLRLLPLRLLLQVAGCQAAATARSGRSAALHFANRCGYDQDSRKQAVARGRDGHG